MLAALQLPRPPILSPLPDLAINQRRQIRLQKVINCIFLMCLPPSPHTQSIHTFYVVIFSWYLSGYLTIGKPHSLCFPCVYLAVFSCFNGFHNFGLLSSYFPLLFFFFLPLLPVFFFVFLPECTNSQHWLNFLLNFSAPAVEICTWVCCFAKILTVRFVED